MAIFRTAIFALVAALLLATPEARSLRTHNHTKTEIEKVVADIKSTKESAEDTAADAQVAAEDAEEVKEDAEDDAAEAQAPVKDAETSDAETKKAPLAKKQKANPLTHDGDDVVLIGEVDEVLEDQAAARGMPISDEAKKADVETVPVEAPLAEGMEKADPNQIKHEGVYNPITGQVESFLQTGEDDETEDLDEDDAKIVSDDSEEEEAAESEEMDEDAAEDSSDDSDSQESEDVTESGVVTEDDDVSDSEEAEDVYNQAEESVMDADEVSFIQTARKTQKDEHDDDSADADMASERAEELSELDEDDAKIAGDDSEEESEDQLEAEESEDVSDEESALSTYNEAEEQVMSEDDAE